MSGYKHHTENRCVCVCVFVCVCWGEDWTEYMSFMLLEVQVSKFLFHFENFVHVLLA